MAQAIGVNGLYHHKRKYDAVGNMRFVKSRMPKCRTTAHQTMAALPRVEIVPVISVTAKATTRVGVIMV